MVHAGECALEQGRVQHEENGDEKEVSKAVVCIVLESSQHHGAGDDSDSDDEVGQQHPIPDQSECVDGVSDGCYVDSRRCHLNQDVFYAFIDVCGVRDAFGQGLEARLAVAPGRL